jgi:hypothetical protein
MRGDERVQDGMFRYVSLEQRVPADPPLRAVGKLTDVVLRSLSAELDALDADSGRPSIAPESILRALLLQVFYSVRLSNGCTPRGDSPRRANPYNHWPELRCKQILKGKK